MKQILTLLVILTSFTSVQAKELKNQCSVFIDSYDKQEISPLLFKNGIKIVTKSDKADYILKADKGFSGGSVYCGLIENLFVSECHTQYYARLGLYDQEGTKILAIQHSKYSYDKLVKKLAKTLNKMDCSNENNNAATVSTSDRSNEKDASASSHDTRDDVASGIAQ